MHVFDQIEPIQIFYPDAVVAIGNFDGLHQGHRYLLKHAKEIADVLGLPLAVLTFHPHPRAFFNPDGGGFRVMPRAVKAERLEEYGVDYVFFMPFDDALAALSPHDFVKTVLVDGLGAKHIVVGEDFGFGHKREGDIETLSHYGQVFGYAVSALPKLTDAAHAYYGSSRIREALKKGDMTAAHDYMDHWWEIEAEVIHGDKRGRTIGYPTANMVLGDLQEPAYGVYACMAGVPDGDGIKWYSAVANFGVRPMFQVRTPLFEVHLFDFDGDLYGKRLRVRLVDYIRAEMKFDSVQALVEQMDKDSAQAKKRLVDSNLSI